MSKWKKENCRNCKNQKICRWQKTITATGHLELPTWEMNYDIQKYLRRVFPKECGHFEAIQEYENRAPDGTLYGRKPLKLWYPNQEPEEPNYGTFYREIYGRLK